MAAGRAVSGRIWRWPLGALLLAAIFGRAANPGAADPPASADNATLAASAPGAAVEPGLERANRDEESRYQKLIEVHHALLARRAALDARQDAARNEWAEATTEFNRLEPQRRALRMENARLESMHVIPPGRFTTAQRAQYNRITDQLRELTAQYNDLQATAVKAMLRRQQAIKQQSEAQHDLHELRRESDALCRQWLAGLDFLRVRSRVEHQALWSLFSKLLENDSDHAGAVLGRGLSAWKLGRRQEAASDFERAIDLDEGCAAAALAARARLECELGKGNEGQADFARAFKMAHNSARLYLLRGMASAAERDYPAAQHDFETANRSSEVTSEGYRLLALLYAAWSTSPSDRQAQLAIDAAERACKLTDSKDWACLEALAAAHAAAGQFDEAVNTASQAADLALGDNRQICLEHECGYAAHEPPRIDWH